MRGARVHAELRVHNVQRDMAQRELRNPPAFLKTEPANTVPTGNTPAVPEPDIVANRPKNDRILPLYLKHPDQMPLLPTDDSRQRRRKEKYNAAAQAMDAYQLRWREGNFDLAADMLNIQVAVLKLRDAELALCPDAESILGTLGKYLEFVRSLQKVASVWVNSDGSVGASTPLGEARMREECVEMQFKMAKLIREQAEKDREKLPPAAIGGSPSDGNVVSPGSPPVAKASTERLPLLLTRPPLERQAGDDEWHKLLKERFNAAVRGLQASYSRHKVDPTAAGTNVISAARRVLAADLALMSDSRFGKKAGESPVDARKRYFELMKYLEREAEARFKARMGGLDELEAAHEARLDAELELLEAKQKLADGEQSRIQSTDAAVVVAKAELEAAKATVERRKAVLQRQTAALAYQKIQYERIRHLYEQKAIEAPLVTEQRDKRDAASAAVEEARAALDAAESELSIKQVRFDQLAKLSQTK